LNYRYEDLKAMTDAKVSSSFLPKTSEVMTKLQTYAHMDHKTVSYAKVWFVRTGETFLSPFRRISDTHRDHFVRLSVTENLTLAITAIS
jgi:hypothetical protein